MPKEIETRANSLEITLLLLVYNHGRRPSEYSDLVRSTISEHRPIEHQIDFDYSPRSRKIEIYNKESEMIEHPSLI